jgi:ferredoxin/flavodoxin---NADP+ reductase
MATQRPVRVAIVGSGPAGFYAAEALLKHGALRVEIDLFERLPSPFGLVRFGVAPDHQRIRRASRSFERTAANARFRFLGNVEVGREISVDELCARYDQVLITVGCAVDRELGIPGEQLEGCTGATEFVSWYNGHPDFAARRFDLSVERVVVVGMGNVALDVTRMLVRDPDTLAETDIADYALAALRESRVREVVVIGRRGPAEAAFDERELRDIAELDGVSVHVDPADLTEALGRLDELDTATRRNVETMSELAEACPAEAERRVRLRFLASPVEVLGEGHMRAVRIEKNELAQGVGGRSSARGTGRFDEIEAGMLVRSIGYRGVALPSVPFDEERGLIPNREGRVTDGPDGGVVPGLYVAGWIKRGPTGVIGTNKKDAQQTVAHMLEDLADALPHREHTAQAIDALLAERGVRVATYFDEPREASE